MEKEDYKNKNKVIIMLSIIICVIILVVISLLLIGIITFNSSSSDNNKPSNSTIRDDSNKISESKKYTASSSQDFINYLNSIEYSDYDNYEIIYDKIKFKIEVNEILPGYNYGIYYDNNLLKSYQLLENDYLVNGGKFYLLTENKNNAFVIVNEIGPIAAQSRYLILSISFDGKILLNQQSLLLSSDKIEVSDNKIKYSYQTKMQEEFELEVAAETKKDFCDYLRNNYKDDYIVTGTKEYQFINGSLSLIKDDKNTIKNYKEKYNCN